MRKGGRNLIHLKVRVNRPEGQAIGIREDLAVRLEDCGTCRIQVEPSQYGPGLILIADVDAPPERERRAAEIVDQMFARYRDGWLISIRSDRAAVSSGPTRTSAPTGSPHEPTQMGLF